MVSCEFTYKDRLLVAQEATRLGWETYGDLVSWPEECLAIASWWARDWSPLRGTDEMPEYSRIVHDLGDWLEQSVSQWVRCDGGGA